MALLDSSSMLLGEISGPTGKRQKADWNAFKWPRPIIADII